MCNWALIDGIVTTIFIIFFFCNVALGGNMTKCGSSDVLVESLVDQKWMMCFSVQEADGFPRLSIEHRSDAVTCTKQLLSAGSDSWLENVEGSLERNNVNITCTSASPAGMYTMCLTVYNGSTHDIGWWNFEVTEAKTGNKKKLCSMFLILKRRDFPSLKSKCIDFKSPSVGIDMDFEEEKEVEFIASLYYKDKELCKLRRKEECGVDTLTVEMCHSYFACNVSRDIIEDVIEKHGNNVAGHVTVQYQSLNVKRKTKTAEKLQMKDDCTPTDKDLSEGKKGLELGEILAIILTVSVPLVSAVALFILYKKGKIAKCISFIQKPRNKPKNDQSEGSSALGLIKENDPNSELMDKNDGDTNNMKNNAERSLLNKTDLDILNTKAVECGSSALPLNNENDTSSESMEKPVDDTNNMINPDEGSLSNGTALDMFNELNVDPSPSVQGDDPTSKLIDKPEEDTGGSEPETILDLR